MTNKYVVNDRVRIAANQKKYRKIFGDGQFTIKSLKRNSLANEYYYNVVDDFGKQARGIPERALDLVEEFVKLPNIDSMQIIKVTIKKEYDTERRLIRIVDGQAQLSQMGRSVPTPFTYVLKPGESVDMVRLDSPPITNRTNLTARQRRLLGRKEAWLVLRYHEDIVGLPESVLTADNFVEIESRMVNLPSKKKAYELNKTSGFCHRCNQRTERKALFLGIINYCSCTE